RVRALSAPRRAPAPARHQSLWRRAADAGDRPRPHVQPEAAAHRRDLARPGAGGGQAALRRAGHRHCRGHDHGRRRAGREPGAAHRAARVLLPERRRVALGAAGRAQSRSHRRRVLRRLVVGWLDTIVQGLLLGGLYALFATGLSLIFGVMRIVNLAHGDFSILAAFVAVVLVEALALHWLLALALVVPLMALLG